MKSQETTNYTEKLLGLLPRGGAMKIAETLNIHYSSVTRALNGKTQNDEVIAEAIKLIEETKQKEELLKQKIESL